MADWTPERIAKYVRRLRDEGDIFYLAGVDDALALLDLAQRGLSAEQDAAKARALIEWLAELVESHGHGKGDGLDCPLCSWLIQHRSELSRPDQLGVTFPEPKAEGETNG